MRAALWLISLTALISAALAQLDLTSRSENRLAAWHRLVDQQVTESELDTIRRVNSFFNRELRFESDAAIWGQTDYWATPFETMRRGSGDCEDFVIAKYFTLLNMRFPPDKLRLIYVRARIGGVSTGYNQAHMVLGYYPNATAEPMILDNLIGDILPASRRTDLTPVFSFNSQGLWTRGAAPVAHPSSRLSRWRGLMERMSREGATMNPLSKGDQ